MIIKISNSYAEDALILNQGESAPYTGILLSEDKARELYDEINKYKLLSESYEKSINLYKSNEEILDKKTKFLLEQNNHYYESLKKERTYDDLQKVVYYSLGFLSVIAGAYGVKAITK